MKPRAMTVGAAGISECGCYRYWLTRTWNPRRATLCWVLLNPSTADADRDDPTIRRCQGFARSWGYGGIVVVNLFAYRATDCRALSAAGDPVGPGNDRVLRRRTARHGVVVGWGNQGELRGRAAQVLELLRGRRILCLGTTLAGQPRHPLYVLASTRLRPYPATAG